MVTDKSPKFNISSLKFDGSSLIFDFKSPVKIVQNDQIFVCTSGFCPVLDNCNEIKILDHKNTPICNFNLAFLN